VFWGAAAALEPGIHTPQRCGVWIPRPPLRGVPEVILGAAHHTRSIE
jgi:hypothetical protein